MLKSAKEMARLTAREENHFNWKGDSIGYAGIHKWINRVAGSPSLCDDCGTTSAKKFEWANISGKYKRILSDWKRLCVSCHRKFDNHSAKAWDTRGRTKIEKKCEICTSTFQTYQARITIGRGKYCSKNCYYQSLRKEVV